MIAAGSSEQAAASAFRVLLSGCSAVDAVEQDIKFEYSESERTA